MFCFTASFVLHARNPCDEMLANYYEISSEFYFNVVYIMHTQTQTQTNIKIVLFSQLLDAFYVRFIELCEGLFHMQRAIKHNNNHALC